MRKESRVRTPAWILEAESTEREHLEKLSSDYNSAPWLFGLSYNEMKNDAWRALISAVIAECKDRPLGRLLARV